MSIDDIKKIYRCSVFRCLTIITCLLIFAGFSPRLWPLNPDTPLADYILETWTIKKGFISDMVEQIAQTPDGYLWISTANGLIRYDGLQFDLIKHNIRGNMQGSETPPIRMPHDFLVDDAGALWLSIDKGVFRYKQGRFAFFPIGDNDDFPATSLGLDRAGTVYTGRTVGYFRFENGKFVPVPIDRDIHEKLSVTHTFRDNLGRLWLSAYNSGVIVRRDGRFKRMPLKAISGSYHVYCSSGLPNGKMWFGTDKGLVSVQDHKQHLYTTRDGLADNTIYCMLIDSDGQLWLGTSSGISLLKTGPKGNIDIQSAPGKFPVRTLWEDRDKNIWAGGWGMGMIKYSDRLFKHYYREMGVPGDHHAVYKDRRGEIWLGSSRGELFKYTGKKFKLLFTLGTRSRRDRIASLIEDSRGDLWIGTMTDSPFRVSLENGRYKIDKGHVKANAGNILLYDRENCLWVFSVQEGILYRYSPSLRTWNPVAGDYHGESIYSGSRDDRGNIWLPGKKGLYFFKSDRPPGTPPQILFPGTNFRFIHRENREFWLGSRRRGLVRIPLRNDNPRKIENNARFYSLHSANIDFSVLDMFADKRGNFWFLSNRGILKAERDRFDDFTEVGTNKIECYSYGFADGMENIACTCMPRLGFIETDSGQYWIPTGEGLTVFHPDKIPIKKNPPPVVLKNVTFNGAEVDIFSSQHVYEGMHNLNFHFNAPTFNAPGKILFKYRLEGYEQEWHIVGQSRQQAASYRNIPPGRYSFHVTARNNSGIWNPKGMSFNFTLEPYFYQTAFFKIALSVFLLTLAAAFYIGTKRFLYTRNLKNKYRHSPLNPDKSEKYLVKILTIMDVEQPYKDENLTLSQLASKLPIQPRYLSQIVNDRLGKNFRDFVNSYRIEEAKRLLSNGDNSSQSILEIALDVGFNSKEVFNRAFKKNTGMTPTDYKKNGVSKTS